MNDGETILGWLEQTSGGRVPIVGTCSIGRLSSNTIMLADERVSRRHALINVQGQHEFWLVDLGSGNGTYLNGRRVVQPTRLRDGDKIEIGSFRLQFQQAAKIPGLAPLPEKSADKTFQQIHSVDCWLLVADLADSTHLVRNTPATELPLVTGRWLEACRQLIEFHGGSINKFLGDGFFAYWRSGLETENQVATTVQELNRLQKSQGLTFRFVLHHGQVLMGGGASLGEESLQGKEVHFLFRMEKLAGSIGEHCLVSAAAKARLSANICLMDAGMHSLAGFDGEYAFYTLGA